MNHWLRSSASVRYRQTVSTGASSALSSRMAPGPMRWIGVRIAAWTSVIWNLLLLVALDECLELIETNGPEPLPLPEPAIGIAERLSLERAQMRSADLAARNQAGIHEDFHVLRRAGE